MKVSSPAGHMHLLGWVLITVLNTLIVLESEKRIRMILLIFVIILQFATIIFFMVDYERLGREQWKIKEKELLKKFSKNNHS
jgi:hypothetical protein